MDELFLLLNGIRQMSASLQDYLQSTVIVESIKKGDRLLEVGQICRRVIFIFSGVFRCYYIDDDGNEICSWFMQEGDVIISVGSFYTQEPGYEGIQALSECRIGWVSYQELQKIYDRFPEFERHGRILTEKYNIISDKEKYLLRSKKSPKERFDYLEKIFPQLTQRVPKAYIASYLGVSKWELSR